MKRLIIGNSLNFNSLAGYLKIARFDHWIKQLFILPGCVFAMFLVKENNILDNWTLFLSGFLATCLIASANYIINEYLDREFDKFHPTKKTRPVVSENLRPLFIWLEYILFTVAGLFLGWIVSLPVFTSVSALWIMGIVYNVRPVRSKEIPFIDVLSESINNGIRLFIGWFLVTSIYLPPISIVIGYWMGGAFLMATKRFAEYRMIGDKQTAALYRKSFQYYTENSLLLSAFFYAMLSVFFCGIFMIKYRMELLIAIPFLCGLFCLYFNICYKHDSSAQKPEKLFKEKWLMVYVAFFIILLAFLMFVNIPSLQFFLDSSLKTV